MDDYYDLGTHSLKVTTVSDAAQTWFDRGHGTEVIKQRLDLANARTDVLIRTSCCCRLETA